MLHISFLFYRNKKWRKCALATHTSGEYNSIPEKSGVAILNQWNHLIRKRCRKKGIKSFASILLAVLGNSETPAVITFIEFIGFKTGLLSEPVDHLRGQLEECIARGVNFESERNDLYVHIVFIPLFR